MCLSFHIGPRPSQYKSLAVRAPNDGESIDSIFLPMERDRIGHTQTQFSRWRSGRMTRDESYEQALDHMEETVHDLAV